MPKSQFQKSNLSLAIQKADHEPDNSPLTLPTLIQHGDPTVSTSEEVGKSVRPELSPLETNFVSEMNKKAEVETTELADDESADDDDDDDEEEDEDDKDAKKDPSLIFDISST